MTTIRNKAAFAGAWLRERFFGEYERWVLWLPVGLGLGVALYFHLPQEPRWNAGMFWVGSGVLFSVWSRRRPFWLGLSLVVLVVGAGFAAAQWRAQSVRAPVLAEPWGAEWIEGVIASVEPRRNGHRLVLEQAYLKHMPWEERPQRVRVTTRMKAFPFLPGERVACRAKLYPPARPSVPGGFDFARQAWFAGIGAVGYCVTKVYADDSPPAEPGWKNKLSRIRHQVTGRILTALDGTLEARIAAALLTGEKGSIPEETLEVIRTAGLAHLLAISGLHLGLVTGICFLAARLLLMLNLRWAARRDLRKPAALAALLGGGCYLLLAGVPVSAMRAYLMVSLFLTGVILGRPATPIRCVAWAAALILLIWPESLLSASFQLSFAATTALVAAYEGYANRREYRPLQPGWLARGGRYVGGVLMTSLIAGAATGPFAAHLFNQFHPYGVLSNMVAVPLTAFGIMPAGLLALVAMPFGWEHWPLEAMGWGIGQVVAVAGEVAALPGADRHAPSLPLWGVACLALGGCWLLLWRQVWRWAGLAVAALGMASGFWQSPPDLLIDEKGKHILYRHPEHGYLFLGGGRLDYTAEKWQERFGVTEEKRGYELLPHCTRERCEVEHGGVKVVYEAKPPHLMLWLPEQEPVTVSQDDLQRKGVHAVWFDPPRLRNVQEERGRRLWVKR